MARKRVVQLSVAEVEHIALVLARKWMDWNEPIPDFHTRYPNALESCLSTPFMYFNRKQLYPRLVDKAAILFYLLIKNHPFVNGNKRIAVTSLLIFLLNNGKWIRVRHEDLYEIAVEVAKSEAKDKRIHVAVLTEFVTKYLVPFSKTEKKPAPTANEPS